MLVGVTSTTSAVFAKKIADLSGNQVVPPVKTTAIGKATFKHPNDSTMNYRVNITGIFHATGINIHMGKNGSNGDIIVDLMKPAKEQVTKVGMITTGSFTASDLIGPMKGKNILDLVSSMKGGDTYIIVNTQKHPSGEIRGQIELANSQSLNETNSTSIGNQANMTQGSQ